MTQKPGRHGSSVLVSPGHLHGDASPRPPGSIRDVRALEGRLRVRVDGAGLLADRIRGSPEQAGISCCLLPPDNRSATPDCTPKTTGTTRTARVGPRRPPALVNPDSSPPEGPLRQPDPRDVPQDARTLRVDLVLGRPRSAIPATGLGDARKPDPRRPRFCVICVLLRHLREADPASTPGLGRRNPET